MSKEIQVLEQKEVEIGGVNYRITAFPAMYGMEVAEQMMGDGFDIKKMKDIILKSATYENKAFNDKTFDYHFSRKYNQLNELFAQIMAFNFGELDPNELSDTSESEDTQD